MSDIFSFSIDFDELRERVVDGIYFVTGQVIDFAESVIDLGEELYEQLPDA